MNNWDWSGTDILSRMLDIEHLVPGAIVLVLGALLGWATAKVIRNAARTLGCLTGITFVLVHVLAYFGVIRWTWMDIAEYAEPIEEAARGALYQLRVLTYSVPFTVGGLLGFFYGMGRP